VRRYFAIWALTTALACAWVYARSHLTLAALPDAASARFAYATLAAESKHDPAAATIDVPQSARSYRASGPIFVTAYADGQRRARVVGDGDLADVVLKAARQFGADPELQSFARDRDRLRFRVSITRGSGPLLSGMPVLSDFSLVPLRDGVVATRASDNLQTYLTPDDLLEHGATDRAVVAPVPDLTFGTSLRQVRELLGEQLGQAGPLSDDGSWQLRRLRIDALPAEAAPAQKADRATLRQAALEGVRFVLRHQADNGRFTYIYDAQRDEALPVNTYSLARHAGTMFFLARAAKQLGLPEARRGALRGLAYIRDEALATCGADDRLCVEQAGRVEFGGSALTALACAELLRGGDDREARRLLTGLTAFLRAQQRPDGEMMHEYSRDREAPVDVQHMYYSGEAALALLTAYEQQKDPRDLQAAAGLMGHLTGAGWGFFGARYYYGEEHWTCQAVAKAASHMQVDRALDFCLRWGRWQENLQYRAGVTPWDVQGAFGVGPVLLPRVTMAASRVEALVPLYRVLSRRRGYGDLRSTRSLIENSLSLLLRMRWAPASHSAPTHLFAKPSAAFGGIPSTGADLRSRVDMVQHAGSAFLAWADALELGY
jgi:hypothetical protein